MTQNTWTKVDVIHHLSRLYGYRTYLEIVTPSTGGMYAQIDRSLFSSCHRLMYRCPDNYDDGLQIDFRSPHQDSTTCINALKNAHYDIILVDPWHEYITSQRDLALALKLIKKNGTIVVHDCLPPNQKTAHFQPQQGAWCGVTYKAFVDLVTTQSNLNYCTIDTDYGCGLIRKNGRRYGSPHDPHDPIIQEWLKIDDDFDRAFYFFHKHCHKLLNLISVEEFKSIQHRSIYDILYWLRHFTDCSCF
ncbi:MAG: class I SAM-dependent methyltransferase [Gammaproteobacteria bacterium]|jgi:hypothetical protein